MSDFVGQVRDAIKEDDHAARYALQVGGSGSWSEPHSGVLCLDGVEGMDGLIPLGDLRLVRHMVRQQPQSVIHAKVLGALEILELHQPNERATPGCVICSAADESCGCMGSGEDWPCQTVIAVGRMFGVEYVPPAAPEPRELTEADLDELRAALDPGDTFGRALLDFERHPELVVNGCPLTREQRIDGAAFRPAWQKIMQEAVRDRLLNEFVESTPLPEPPAPARRERVLPASLDQIRRALDACPSCGAITAIITLCRDRWHRRARLSLDWDTTSSAIPRARKPGEDTISMGVIPSADFASDQVTMRITWRP